MELGLSLGEAAASTAESPFASFLNKTITSTHLYRHRHRHRLINNKGLGFCMGGLAVGLDVTTDSQDDDNHIIAGGTRTRSTSRSNGKAEDADAEDAGDEQDKRALPSPDQQDHPPVVQLNLLPLDPVLPRRNNNNNNHHPAGFPWPSEHGNSEAGSSGHLGLAVGGFDVNQLPASADEGEDGAAVSSPNSTVSSFQIDFSIYSGGGGGGLASNNNTKRDTEAAGLNEVEIEKTSSRASDEEENGTTRKKLRLSKDQSAFLEENFKEHNTLNPKQKLALAKQLNLRPRQVEVWFQNRRARTKLKQTEVDCEYLKRCCETLTEENRRLQKELQELRALKTSHPYYMQLPATTLTMCPSCERVATTSSGDPNVTATTTTTTTGSGTGASSKTSSTGFPFTNKKPRFYPFSQTHHHHHHLHQSAAS